MFDASNIGFSFNLYLYMFCVFGALLLWVRTSSKSKSIHGLKDVFDKFFVSSNKSYVFQFLFFILFGGFAGYVAVAPITATHALAAGMAWSRLAAKD